MIYVIKSKHIPQLDSLRQQRAAWLGAQIWKMREVINQEHPMLIIMYVCVCVLSDLYT